MSPLGTALSAIALVIGAASAPLAAADKADKVDKKVKPKDMPFAQRLDAGMITFTDKPMAPLTIEQLQQFPIIRDPLMEQAAGEILARLMTVHQGTPPSHLPFFVIDGDDINCSTLPTGGAILCTRAVFDELIAAGQRGRDQLAFLLAHELAHVTIASHRVRFEKSDKLKKDVLTAGVYGALIGLAVLSDYQKSGNQITMHATGAATNVFWMALGASMNMSEIANGLVAPSWAKADEEDADAYALILMGRAGYDLHAAHQFLNNTDRTLRKNGMRSTVAGAVLKGAAQSALLQGIASNGKTTSIIIGAVGGAVQGLTQEASLAHYHRAPDKRAASCAEFVKAQDQKKREQPGANEEAQLWDSLDPAKAPVPVQAASAGTKKGARPAHAPPSAPAVMLDGWDRFLAEPGPIAELILSNRIRELIANNHAQEAAALCPPHPKSPKLTLGCGLAYAGIGDAARARPLLASALLDPQASAATYRQVALAEASLGETDEALRTTSTGTTRFADGDLYPDEMMIRAASGDVDGARKVADTCQQKASKEFKTACARGLASLTSKGATQGKA